MARTCSPMDLNEIRELAGKILDGNATELDKHSLADLVITCHGDLTEPKIIDIKTQRESILLEK